MKKNIIRTFKNMLICIFALILLLFSKQYVYAQVKDFTNKVPIFSVSTDEKKIALTFDLNWTKEDNLYEVLDILDQYNVKCTFFVMGKWVIKPETNKEKILEINRRGHEIANHSYEHPNFLQINREQIEKEIESTEKIIYDVTGKRCKYFRFPGGGFTPMGVQIVNSKNLKAIQWSKDSLDWRNRGEEIEYNNVMNGIKSGDIVLLHNNGKYTATNLKKIIPSLQMEGYSLVTIDELLYEDSFFVNENGKQFKIN